MKCKFYRICVQNPAAELLQIGRKLEKYQLRHNLLTRPHRQIFLSAILFVLSNLVTGPSFMSMSSLVLELWKFWQLSFIKDWPEIWKSEIPPHEFCPVSGDEAGLWYQIWYECLLIKCYWMLQNTRVIAFTAVLLLSKNQQEGRRVLLPHNQIRVDGLSDNKAVSLTKMNMVVCTPLEKLHKVFNFHIWRVIEYFHDKVMGCI